MEIFNRLLAITAAICFLTFAFISSYKSALDSYVIPTKEEIKEITNVPSSLPQDDQIALMRSRSSAVQVMSYSETSADISAMSGTYIRYSGELYVLTASHGITAPCELTQMNYSTAFNLFLEIVTVITW
jgi:hypothetical protein